MLSQMITYPNPDVQKLVIQCLFYFIELDDFARFDLFPAYNLIPKIVKFTEKDDPTTALTALKVCGNLTHGDSRIVSVSVLTKCTRVY